MWEPSERLDTLAPLLRYTVRVERTRHPPAPNGTYIRRRAHTPSDGFGDTRIHTL